MMTQEKLKTVRKRKGISQEKMAKILSTDPSNYSRKERGKVKIYEDEWQKLAEALDVSIEDIREEKDTSIRHSDNYCNYDNHHFNIPNPLIESLYDYITLLKDQIRNLKEEIKTLKSQ